MEPKNEVRAGDVGILSQGIKNAREVKVGDTITTTVNGSTESLKVSRM
jgi:GTP-binding protein LepA